MLPVTNPRPSHPCTRTYNQPKQVRAQFEGSIKIGNLCKRLLHGMVLIINHRYCFCVGCGRHDAREVSSA